MNLQMALATAAANKMNQNPKSKGDIAKNPLFLNNIQNILKPKMPNLVGNKRPV